MESSKESLMSQNDTSHRSKTVVSTCFQYRWVLALLLFCLCVCFRLNGSSIGIFNQYFPTQIHQQETTLFGIPRWIRSDEYGVSTPVFFSQQFNQGKLYSSQMGISKTNMVLHYYGPVWDWSAIGKPQVWGYLLFGNEIGLSWYWCSELILIFMTSLEMCLILTKGRRDVSVLGAVMITLSPEIQWWMLPHMPIVIFYSMALFCLGYWFFMAQSTKGKWITAVLTVMVAVGFALSIFPSFQVPCAYTIAILLAVCLYRDRDKLRVGRGDWIRILLTLAVALAILVRFLLISRKDIALLLHTVYPGSRLVLGGDTGIGSLFTDPASLFFPYKDATYQNNCEASNYIHFAPFFLAFSPLLIHRLKNVRYGNTGIGLALAGILLVQIAFMCLGFPQWLSELTLLRYCNRMHGVYDWTATLYTVWGFSALLDCPQLLRRWEKIALPLAYGAVHALTLSGDTKGYFETFVFHGIELGSVILALSLIAFVASLMFVAFGKRRLLFTALMLLMVFSGATVNPIECGIGAVTNHPISAAIHEIAEQEKEGRWLCVDCEFYISNFVMANGARVLNATNFYPDTKKWEILDPDGKLDQVSNRYANFKVVLRDGPCDAELILADYVKLLLSPDTLKKMEVRYLLALNDYTALLEQHGIQCQFIMGQDGYGIYRLNY